MATSSSEAAREMIESRLAWRGLRRVHSDSQVQDCVKAMLQRKPLHRFVPSSFHLMSRSRPQRAAAPETHLPTLVRHTRSCFCHCLPVTRYRRFHLCSLNRWNDERLCLLPWPIRP